MKRLSSWSSEAGGPQQAEELGDAAALLLGLSRAPATGAWPVEHHHLRLYEEYALLTHAGAAPASRSAAAAGTGTGSDSSTPVVAAAAAGSAAAAAAKGGGRHVAKAARTSYSTRSYVWRGPHRGALALQKQQHHQPAAAAENGGQQLQQQQQQQPSADDAAAAAAAQQQLSDANSSRRSSASGALPSEDEEVAQQQQQQQHPQQQQQRDAGGDAGGRQRDKEWAALTTWLRMNLHHPRTAKKLVLFVGEQDAASKCWTFWLNPGLGWDDLSIETKLRLKTLPLEAEQAFLRKYPDRPAHEWRGKVQKYRPPGAASTANVCLGDMVSSLNRIFHEHDEPPCCTPGQQGRQQQQGEQQQAEQQREPCQGQPREAAAPAGVDWGDAAARAAAPVDAPPQRPPPCVAPHGSALKLQLAPAGAGGAADGADSCTESATPVAAVAALAASAAH